MCTLVIGYSSLIRDDDAIDPLAADALAAGPPLQPDAHAISTMAHFLDPRELLAWCETLYQRPPQAWLVSAAGASFDYANCRLGPAAAAALPVMLNEVRRLVEAPLLHQWPARVS